MLTVKFSHNYPKLHGQRTAVLEKIVIRSRLQLNSKLLDYDTLYYHVATVDGHPQTTPAYFKLNGEKFIVLYFIGDSLIPFTTIREYNDFKYRYYRNSLGQQFEIKYLK